MKNAILFTIFFTFSTLAVETNFYIDKIGPNGCWDFADEQVSDIGWDLQDPGGIGEPVFLTYEEEHDLWSSIYEWCQGGSQNFNG